MSSNNLKMKNIKCKLGILSRPDGSALLTQGETTVLAGVYGPIEVKSQKLLINKASIETHYRPKAGLPGIGDRMYESIIQSVCESALVSVLYPRSSILVVIQEMQNCGGLIACAINAACLALLSSGIDMKFLIASVSCIKDEEDILHLNPDRLQLENAKATFVFVFDSISKGIITSYTSGSFSYEQYKDALELCKDASEGKCYDELQAILEFSRNVLVNVHSPLPCIMLLQNGFPVTEESLLSIMNRPPNL